MNSRRPLQPEGEILPKPSYGHSALLSAEKPYYEVAGAIDMIPGMSDKDHRVAIADKLDVIDQTLADPRMTATQQGLNVIGETASSIAITSPLFMAGGALGVGAATAVGFTGRAVAPEAASLFMNRSISSLVRGGLADYVPRVTSKEALTSLASNYVGYKGAVIPEHVMANYHKENDTLDTHQAIQDWSHDNWGFLMVAAPIAAGHVVHQALGLKAGAEAAGKVAREIVSDHENTVAQRRSAFDEAMGKFKGESKSEAEQTKLEQSLNQAYDDGRISKKQRDWVLNYYANPKDHEAHAQGAMEILKDAEYPINRVNGKMWYQILDNNAINKIKQASTEYANNLPYEEQKILSEYVTHNVLDENAAKLNGNPSLLNALRHTVDFIERKLSKREKVLGNVDSMMKEHVFGEEPDVFSHMRETEEVKLMKKLYRIKNNPSAYADAPGMYARVLKANKEAYPNLENDMEHYAGNTLSQESIFNHIMQKGINPKKLPYNIPDTVKEKLSLRKRIAKSTDAKEIAKLNKLDKEMKFEPIHKEIERLMNKVIDKLKGKKNYKLSDEYLRLHDLSDYRDDAKLALHRIDLDHQYNKQEAMNNALKSFIEMADSNAERLAKPEKVTAYLRNKVADALPDKKLPKVVEREEIKPVSAEKTQNEELKSKNKEIDANFEASKESGAEKNTKEFEAHKKQLEQFESNQNVLEEMAECAGRIMYGKA